MTPLRTPRFIQCHVANSEADRREIEAGLLRHPAHASPKYLYDRLGSHLFEAITELPEYYPTRTEAAIIAAHGAAMAQRIGAGSTRTSTGCVRRCMRNASIGWTPNSSRLKRSTKRDGSNALAITRPHLAQARPPLS